MRSVLVLALIALSACVGGWHKVSLYTNDAYIEAAKRVAISKFVEDNGIEADDVEILSIYTQIVAGTNYKFTYVNRNAPLNGIEETVVYVPLQTMNGISVLSDELKQQNGILSLNDPRFSKVHQVVYDTFKESETQKILKMKRVYYISTELATYFICTAHTPRGEGYYAVTFDKESGEYELINKL